MIPMEKNNGLLTKNEKKRINQLRNLADAKVKNPRVFLFKSKCRAERWEKLREKERKRERKCNEKKRTSEKKERKKQRERERERGGCGGRVH